MDQQIIFEFVVVMSQLAIFHIARVCYELIRKQKFDLGKYLAVSMDEKGH